MWFVYWFNVWHHAQHLICILNRVKMAQWAFGEKDENWYCETEKKSAWQHEGPSCWNDRSQNLSCRVSRKDWLCFGLFWYQIQYILFCSDIKFKPFDFVLISNPIHFCVVLISNCLYFSFFFAILCWRLWCSWAVRKHKTCQQHSSAKQKQNPEKMGIELGARSHLATMSREPKLWRETRFHKTQRFCTLEHTLTRHLWERLAKNLASRCLSPYWISRGSSSHLLIPKKWVYID